jgi:hypothetical protein
LNCPTSSFFFGVHADHRVTGGAVHADLVVDVAELGVAVGMLTTLDGLGVGLQAEALGLEQPGHGVGRDRMPLAGQLFGQVARRAGGPPQRRIRVTARAGLDQLQQRGGELRVGLGRTLAPAPGPAGPT